MQVGDLVELVVDNCLTVPPLYTDAMFIISIIYIYLVASSERA